jgi:ParB family transcriptional regulator, chromosome partitioning protein
MSSKKKSTKPAKSTKPTKSTNLTFSEEPGELHDIPVKDILDEKNIRTDPHWKKELDGLVEDIKARGQLQPIRVFKLEKPAANGESFKLDYGSRRLAAMKKLGRHTIQAIVLTKTVSRTRVQEILLRFSENNQRKELSPIDEAHCFKALVNEGMTAAAVAKAVGVSAPQVSQRLSLLEMAPEVQSAVKDGKITATKAREIGRVKDPKEQKILLDESGRKDAKKTKQLVDKKLGKKSALAVTRSADEIAETLTKIGERLDKAKAEKVVEKEYFLKGMLKMAGWMLDKDAKLSL